MRDVVFFTPNEGMESAAEFIFTTLNYGQVPRFRKIDFILIDRDKNKCAALYNTKHKAGSENLLSVEIVRVQGEKGAEFHLMTTMRIRSLHSNFTLRTMFHISKNQEQFPKLDEDWHERTREELGHMSDQDLWNNLLNLKKIRRMPL